MHLMEAETTSQRLSHFEARVEQRFDEVDRRFNEVDRRFGETNERLGRIEGRLDTLARALIYGCFTMTGAMLAGFVAILTQI